jgi:hypothetical protein
MLKQCSSEIDRKTTCEDFSKIMFKLQALFGIRVFLDNGLGSFHTFLVLQIKDKPEMLKRIQKQF